MIKMEISHKYSHNNAEEIILTEFKTEYEELIECFKCLKYETFKTKYSLEKTKKDKILISPTMLNKCLFEKLNGYGWKEEKIYNNGILVHQIDACKGKIMIEFQFGKYAFIANDIFNKMVLYITNKKFKVGIEVLPSKILKNEMSTGVGDFDMAREMLINLSKSTINYPPIPVLLLGISK